MHVMHIKIMGSKYIHRLSITTYPLQGHGGLQPIPADIRQEAGYTLDKLLVRHRADMETNHKSLAQLWAI